MHQCEYCCWWTNEYGCECPLQMKAKACEKAKQNKKSVPSLS